MRALRLTILCDDVVSRSGLEADHGLAILLEGPDWRVLLDTGSGDRVLRNAEGLGVALPPLDALVLSHGHYDHTGGLEAVLREHGPVRVIAHPEVFRRTFALRPDGSQRYIGAPHTLEEYRDLGAEFELSAEAQEVAAGLWTTGQVRQAEAPGRGGPPLCMERGGELVRDDFAADLSLWAVLPGGLVVVTGCAHAGPVNIVRQAREQGGLGRVHGLVGGTHLGPATEADICATAQRLQELGVEAIMPSHCTGPRAFGVLRNCFGGPVEKVGAGDVVEYAEDGTYRLNSEINWTCLTKGD